MFDAIATVIDAKAKPLTARRRPLRGRAAGRGAGRRVRVRARPRRRPGVRRAPPARQRADPAGGPGEPGPRRVPGLRRDGLAGVAADAVLRRRGGADRAERHGSAARRRPGDPDHPRRAAPRGRRPGPRLRASRLRPAGVVVRSATTSCRGSAAARRSCRNLAMLCRAHHRQIHSTEWIVRIRDGLPEFIPPTWIDPRQDRGEKHCHSSLGWRADAVVRCSSLRPIERGAARWRPRPAPSNGSGGSAAGS